MSLDARHPTHRRVQPASERALKRKKNIPDEPSRKELNLIARLGLPRAVVLLGVVSFFTDLSSEMIYPLLPIFLTTVLGTGALALGVVEGIAESTAALMKVVSGIWTDRSRSRKSFIVSGYGISGFIRPLIGLATVWPMVVAIRFIDRIGKGVRTSPRDAMLADVTPPEKWGTSFGFHRAMDHAGAVIGPLIAAALLSFEHLTLRHVFLLAAIPAAIVIAVLVAGVKEPAPKTRTAPKHLALREHWKILGRDFKILLGALLVFTLGNSTDAFLLLRLSAAGVPASWIALLWSFHHIVKMISTYIFGRASDRVERRKLIIAGWVFYAGIYIAFGLVNSPTALIAIFLAYGVYFGMTEPSEKAWVADLIPAHLRGTAFGYYNGVVGIGALPASLLFGGLWQAFGAHVAFMTGAGLAATASFILLLVRHQEPALKEAPSP